MPGGSTPVDWIFGYNNKLRAVAEVYAAEDAQRLLVEDFGAAWTKIMNNHRV